MDESQQDYVEARRQRVVEIHSWRARRARFGELIQWDTSEHDWTEGRGEKMYLVTADRFTLPRQSRADPSNRTFLLCRE